MDNNQALQNLLTGTASDEEIKLLKVGLASGEISIGGNVNQSVIIIGSGNTVELPPAALDRLNARPMLGNLDRDLTGEEIASGLRRLDKLLPNRAPVLLPHYKEQVGRLRPTLKTEIKSLSDSSRRERLEALAAINSICVEAVDVSFNGLCLGEEAPKYDARSPFRGLESFRPEDSKFFFGREALTRKLVAQIQAHPFLAVLGASGSGKSSLVMAGMIPALDSDYVIFRPGTNPLDELESARGKSLIVVDQFEELFTLTRDESTRKDFIVRLLDESSRARIILTLRSDFLGEVGAYRTLSAEIQSHLEIIPPMDMDELRRAMEGQAGVVGLRFEADLSQQILDDVAGEPGAMPLLQHALWELWNRRHGRNLRASEYRAFGGVKQAITSTAEKVYADCSKPEQDQVRDIFLRLTRLDDGDEGRDTRRRAPLGDLIPSGRDVASITLLLDKLANARLVVKTVNEENTEIEVAHEALIRHWERLRIWLNEDRDSLRLQQRVSEAAHEWQSASMDENLLIHHGGRLEDALQLHSKLNAQEQAYLNACKKAVQKRKRMTIASITFTTLVIVAVLIGWGWTNSENLKKAEKEVSANKLLALALKTVDVDPTLAMRILEKAYLVSKTPGITQSINEWQTKYQFYSQSFRHPRIETAIFSPDGKSIITSGEDKVLQWDLSGNIQRDFGEVGPLVAVSPDGQYLITSNSFDPPKLWNLKSGEYIKSFNELDPGWAMAIAISPNGDYFLISDSDYNIVMGDFQGNLLQSFVGHNKGFVTHRGVTSLAFSPDNQYIITGSDDRAARLWDIKGYLLHTFEGHKDYVEGVDFSPRGDSVLTASIDGTVNLWDLTGNLITTVEGQEFYGHSVAFSPDGSTFVTVSGMNELKLWDLKGELLQTFRGHQGVITSVDFSADGKWLLTASSDGTAKLWYIKGLRSRVYLEGECVDSMNFSQDGKKIVTGYETPNCVDTQGYRTLIGFFDANFYIWDMNGNLNKKINTDTRIINIQFSPQGDLAITCDQYSSMRVWNLLDETSLSLESSLCPAEFSMDSKFILTNTKKPVSQLINANNGASNEIATTFSVAAFSPTNDRFVVSMGDETAKVYDLDGNLLSEFKNSDDVGALGFSNAGDLVLLAGQTASIWDLNKGIMLSEFATNQVGTFFAKFSQNDDFIVTVDLASLRVWDINGALLKVYPSNSGAAFLSAAMLPDDNILIGDSRKQIETYVLTGSLNKFLSSKQIVNFTDYEFAIAGDDSSFDKLLLKQDSDQLIEYAYAFLSKAETGDTLDIEYLYKAKSLAEKAYELNKSAEAGVILVTIYTDADIEFDLNSFLVSNNTEDLENFAQYYEENCSQSSNSIDRNRCLKNLKLIYEKLSNIEKKPYYTINLFSIYDQLGMEFKYEDLPLPNNAEDLVSVADDISRSDSIDYLLFAAFAYEEALKIQPSADIQTKAAVVHGNLSWYQILDKNFMDAITSAQKGLELDANQEWIRINLAHALLLNGEFDKAKTIYFEMKDKTYENTTYLDVIIYDLTAIKDADIANPDIDKMISMLQGN